MWALLQPIQEHAAEAAGAAQEPVNVSEAILEHVANSSHDNPLIFSKIWIFDFSVTKHVFMLWLVAATIFVVVTLLARRCMKSKNSAPTGMAGALEYFVEAIRDNIGLPNFGKKWVNTWTPLVLTLFLFIFSANLIGMIPIFESLNVLNHFAVHAGHETFFGKVIHGSPTVTGNFNVPQPSR